METAGNLAGLDADDRRFTPHFRHDGLASFLDALDLPIQRRGNHVDRLSEAEMPGHRSVCHAFAEGLGRQTDALAGQNRGPVGGKVIDPFSGNLFDIAAHPGQRDDQQIEHETGIDAGPNDGDTMFQGETVHLVGNFRRPAGRIGHFLGDRDHGNAVFNERQDLVPAVRQRRAGGLDRHIRPCSSDGRLEVAVHFQAEIAIQPDGPAKVGSRALGPPAEGSGQGEARFVESHASDSGSHLPGSQDQHPNRFLPAGE